MESPRKLCVKAFRSNLSKIFLIKYREEQQHGGKGSQANTINLFTPMLHIYGTMGDATS